MEFRFQEVLTWIVPGFYLMLCAFCVAWLVWPVADAVPPCAVCTQNPPALWFKMVVNGGDALMALLLFTIPILSLIVGWLINGSAGYLFRLSFKMPFVNAYEKYVVNRDRSDCRFYNLPKRFSISSPEDWKELTKAKKTKEAERGFDFIRDNSDLEVLDRFYYRYVFSRNMFVAQIVITMLSVLGLAIYDFISHQGDLCLYFTVWVMELLLVGIFYQMVSRDLFTHAKGAFNNFNKEKK